MGWSPLLCPTDIFYTPWECSPHASVYMIRPVELASMALMLFPWVLCLKGARARDHNREDQICFPVSSPWWGHLVAYPVLSLPTWQPRSGLPYVVDWVGTVFDQMIHQAYFLAMCKLFTHIGEGYDQ